MTNRDVLAGPASATEQELRRRFLQQVRDVPGGDRIARCLQCGTCTGSCPVSYAMDISPRMVIALFRAGDAEGEKAHQVKGISPQVVGRQEPKFIVSTVAVHDSNETLHSR